MIHLGDLGVMIEWPALALVALVWVGSLVLVRSIVRRKQSAVYIAELRADLREEKRRHEREEAAHARKLAVYRDVAIRSVVEYLRQAAGE